MDGQPSTVQPDTFIPNEAYKGLLKLVVPVDGVDQYVCWVSFKRGLSVCNI